MGVQQLSVKSICLLIAAGELASMLLILAVLFIRIGEASILWGGGLLIGCALLWMFLLVWVFGRRLGQFSGDLCSMMDGMITGGEKPIPTQDQETLFSRITHRLFRLYGIMEDNRQKVEVERQELQILVSDISHQVKTPLANLKMVSDTLLSKQVSVSDQRVFLQGIRSQGEKLEFLLQALVKASRLETGVIQLERKPALLFDTLAQAMGDMLYEAEAKDIFVQVDCPEDLYILYDEKWTGEAIFNVLDNAVKYTPIGGRIQISAVPQEFYVRLDIADNGPGVSEKEQGAIFQRFYRGVGHHDVPGVGIGLYVTREIITRQGGYIVLHSREGKGATFSIYLPMG